MANRNWMSNKMYQMEAYPVLVSCNFAVTPTNGLGITSLKGGAVRNVFMHTSTTPASNNGYLNPNPETGIIMVQLQDNYSKYLGGFSSIVGPLDGSSQTSTTAGNLSVISVLGTASLAQWQAKGLPVGITPALGVPFVATATGAIGGSGAVQRPVGSGVDTIELCANPNAALAIANSPVNGGAFLYFECLGDTITGAAFTGTAHVITGTVAVGVIPVATGTAGDAVTNNAGVLNSVGGQDVSLNAQAFTGENYTPAGTISGTSSGFSRVAPGVGSIISLSFYLSNSSVVVNGQ